MSKESFSVEYSGNINYKSENIGLCKFYPETIEGYKQAVQDLKVYKAHQSKHIEELEHRLSNCIEPKFKIGQEVWFVDNLSEEIYVGEVDFIEAQKFKRGNIIWYQVEYFDKCTMSGPFEESFIFATEEEAKAKLRSLKDGCDRT